MRPPPRFFGSKNARFLCNRPPEISENFRGNFRRPPEIARPAPPVPRTAAANRDRLVNSFRTRPPVSSRPTGQREPRPTSRGNFRGWRLVAFSVFLCRLVSIQRKAAAAGWLAADRPPG